MAYPILEFNENKKQNRKILLSDIVFIG